jgi:hypothetical protein
MRSIANSITDKGRRTAVTAAAAASRSSTDTAVRYGTAGDVMLAMNQLSLGRSDPRLRVVKNCIDQVRTAAMSAYVYIMYTAVISGRALCATCNLH